MPQQWKDVTIIVPHISKNRTKCGSYRGISEVAHAGNISLKIISRLIIMSCKRVGILPEKPQWFPIESFYHRYDVRDSSVT